MTVARLYTWFFLTGLVTTGLWMNRDRLGPPVFLPLMGLIALLSVSRSAVLRELAPIAGVPPGRPAPLHIAATAAIISPALLFFLKTFFQEFPFSGDHLHHPLVARYFLRFCLRQAIPLVVAGFLLWTFRRRLGAHWPIVLMGLLVVWSYFGATPTGCVRYPGLTYCINLPLQLLFSLAPDYEINALRATNVLSIGRVAPGSQASERKQTLLKEATYECGMTTYGSSFRRIPIKYYIIAMLFLIFDIEIVFLYPWAVIFKQLKVFGLISMAVFIGILIIAYIYIWKKGALEWE